MSDFQSRESEASELRKAYQFKEALAIYRELWKDHQDQFNEWATWSYAKCAQKCDQLDEAERIVRVCVDKWPDFPQGRQLLAWCHYYRHFQNAPPPNQPVSKEYWRAAEDVVALCADDPHSQYAPCVRVVFTIVKRLEDYQDSSENVQKRIDWLDRLDPAQLGERGDSFTDKDGKVRKVASDRENWYSHMSKALLAGKRYDDCMALCKQALGNIRRFHYDNDIWFGKRIAESKAALGLTEEALADCKQLTIKKPEWFLYYDMACLAHKMKDDDQALRYAAEGALAHGPLHFKADLFLLLAVLLRADDQTELAKQHAQLAASARSEQKWPAKGARRKHFDSFGALVEGGPPAKGIAKQLKKQWQEWSAQDLPEHHGEIDWFDNEKGFGFIKVDGQSDSVFFHIRSFKGSEDSFDGGTRVTFTLKDSFDKKKGEMSTQAVDVRLFR